MTESPEAWLEPVLTSINTAGATGGVMVILPEYRPTLSRSIAHAAGIPFRDFRDDVLLQRGWDAFQEPLSTLDDYINDGGGVIMNCEALLATKTERERKDWFAAFAATKRPLTILPLALYGAEAPSGNRTVTIDPELVPEETILMRLVEM